MSEATTYRIDETDTIVFLDDAWIRFGKENDLQLSPRVVVGQRLWTFISNPQTRELYSYILKRVRQKRVHLHVHFRCDGPDRRRFMELGVQSLPNGRVEFKCTTIREEERIPIELFDADSVRTSDSLKVCSWCKLVEVSEARWLEVEDAIEELSLFDAGMLPELRHCNCPKCVASIRAEVLQTLH